MHLFQSIKDNLFGIAEKVPSKVIVRGANENFKMFIIMCDRSGRRGSYQRWGPGDKDFKHFCKKVTESMISRNSRFQLL